MRARQRRWRPFPNGRETTMSDNDNKDALPAEVDKSPAAPRRHGAGLLASLALIVALAAAGGAGWLYYQLIYLSDQQSAAVVAKMQAALNSATSRNDATDAALNRQRERLAELDSLIDQQQAISQRQLQQLSAQVQELSAVDRNDWLLAEAEYLLRLANQRLQLSGDSRAAARLLGSADAILRELDDPALHPVRSELAKELSALQSLSNIDIEGLYLQLEGLAGEVDKLEAYGAPEYNPAPVADADSTWQSGLATGFQRAWEKLRSYIRIRQHDDKFRAELAPEQADALRASLRMMLEQAQLALLAERPTVYQRALDKAANWLQRYFPLNDRREALATQLEKLGQADIRGERPDISGSLRALKEYSKAQRWQREVGQ
ncbi:MAG: hypothetical protein CMN82_08030 [Spongiibacter sp.]|nr:hypothetical protein [Spongiibacter sp.]MBI57151.1 hypothetical protein [Spongiibacter sp.]